MFPCKILFGNLGYARGISGELVHHMLYAHRHFYCSPAVQQRSLRQLSEIIVRENPDICCFVEIDKGSFATAGFNQLESLLDEKYAFSDIENKYAPGSRLRSFFMTSGKSNAFLTRHSLPFKRLYFKSGIKRLIYRLQLGPDLTLFFTHLSLSRKVRARQIAEIGELMNEAAETGEAIFLGDFNILTGMKELDPLLDGGRLVLLNRAEETTFAFHKRRLLLDLCICSKGVAGRTSLKIVPQPFSDHAALLLDVQSA